ncbi:hypothetical protein V8C86DRAFT_2750897 [Haematococcus lacustris]
MRQPSVIRLVHVLHACALDLSTSGPKPLLTLPNLFACLVAGVHGLLLHWSNAIASLHDCCPQPLMHHLGLPVLSSPLRKSCGSCSGTSKYCADCRVGGAMCMAM